MTRDTVERSVIDLPEQRGIVGNVTGPSKAEVLALESLRAKERIIIPEDWPDTDRRLSAATFVKILSDALWANQSFGIEVTGAVIDEPLSHDYLRVAAQVSLNRCAFRGGVTLRYSLFERFLRVQSCQFDHGLDLSNSVIKDLLQFTGTDAVFRGPVSLVNCSIDGDASFESCQFHSSASLAFCEVKGSLQAIGCEFLRSGTPVDINSARIDGHLNLEGSTFADGLSCTQCQVDGQVVADRTVFKSPSLAANFNGAKMSGGFFRDARFVGPVNFATAQVTEELSFKDALFEKSEPGAQASGRSEDSLTFPEETPYAFGLSVFDGFAIFDGARFSGDVSFVASKGHILSLCRCVVEGSLSLRETAVDELMLVGVDVRGVLDLTRVRISGTLNAQFPADGYPHRAKLEGLRYDRLELAPGVIVETRQQWQKWLSLPDHFTPSAYLALEGTLRRFGSAALANRVYLAMRRAERETFRRDHRFVQYLASWFLELSAGYGVRAWLLCMWPILVLLLAWRAFVLAAPPSVDRWSTLLYVADVFLPVDLGQKAPAPSIEQMHVLYFLTSLAGWILVPLALAQIAGLLKRET